jgi:hypothetical protein
MGILRELSPPAGPRLPETPSRQAGTARKYYLSINMKIATEIALQATQDRIWNILIDFPAYPEWNRLMKAVRGQAAPDAPLEVDLHYWGKPVQTVAGRITGFMAPKYLSWSYAHRLGAWFLNSEHVLRLKEKEDGRVIFFQEVYHTGLGLRFRRRDVEHYVRLSLDKLNDDLKHRLSEAGASAG